MLHAIFSPKFGLKMRGNLRANSVFECKNKEIVKNDWRKITKNMIFAEMIKNDFSQIRKKDYI